MRSSVSADYVYDMGMVIRSSRAAALRCKQQIVAASA